MTGPEPNDDTSPGKTRMSEKSLSPQFPDLSLRNPLSRKRPEAWRGQRRGRADRHRITVCAPRTRNAICPWSSQEDRPGPLDLPPIVREVEPLDLHSPVIAPDHARHRTSDHRPDERPPCHGADRYCSQRPLARLLFCSRSANSRSRWASTAPRSISGRALPEANARS